MYYHGKLWVQVKAESSMDIASEGRRVDLASFAAALPSELWQEYNLVEVHKPFYFAQDSKISEVFELEFAVLGGEDELAQKVGRLDDVGYAERVPIMRITTEPNDLGPASGSGNQYGLWIIDALSAWNLSTGDGDIQVAIVDDAVLVNHPDLIPNLVPGWDVSQDNADPMPNEPGMTHGTHVAGIVGAATNNGIGVASIGYNLKIMPVKSSNSPQFVTDAYAGVIWSAENGADVINMSWGGSGFSQTGQNIINYAYGLGCVNVAAAGNDNVSTVFYPAGYNNVISVASTASADQKSGFSNFGAWIDVAAPGSNILSTYHNNYQASYASISGTSMASPMVAGLAGLILSMNPEMPQAQVRDCILSSADNIDAQNPGFVGQLGSGRINAYEALLCTQATINAPPQGMISSTEQVSCPGNVIQFFGASSAGLATSYSWTFPGGNPASSEQQNPLVVYSEPGMYDVILEVSNDFGNDVLTQNGFIEVSSNGVDIFYIEEFEGSDLADAGWSSSNESGSLEWVQSSVGGTVSGNQAAGIFIFGTQSTGQRAGLISPPINLSGHANAALDFQHAHRRRAANIQDSLIVYVSTDGGNSFPHRIFAAAENGQGNFATGAIVNQNFVPANGNDWCFGGDLGSACFTLDLSDFDGEVDVRIMFEAYSGGGNNIFIDNVQVSGNCMEVQAAPIAAFDVMENGLCAGSSIQFVNQSSFVPTSYSWTFEGGNPSSSTEALPNVSYENPGSYDVQLVVSNDFGADTLMLEGFVQIASEPELSISASTTSICEGESLTLTASGAETYTWSPMAGLSSTSGSQVEASPTSSTTYTVTGSNLACSAEMSIEIEVLPSPPEPSIVSGNDVSLTVLGQSPSAGHYPFSGTSSAGGWGSPAPETVSVMAQLVIGRDNSAGDSLLCNQAANAAQLNGQIAVVYRGGCEFGQKAFNAQNAGAAAVIVVNNAGGGTIDMGPGAQGGNVNIPTVMVSLESGAIMHGAAFGGQTQAVLGQFIGGGPGFCPGEMVLLAAPAGGEAGSYEWSDGSSNAVIEITEAGSYFVSTGNEQCTVSSASFTAFEHEVSIPLIEWDGADVLSTSNVENAQSYQWFLNGIPVEGANAAEFIPQEAGLYTVAVIDANGCESLSEAFEFNIFSTGNTASQEAELEVYPVPSRDRVRISLGQGALIEAIMVFSVEGKQIPIPQPGGSTSSNLELDISSWSPGVYMLQVHSSGTVHQGRLIKVN